MFFRNFVLLASAPIALAKVQFLGVAIAGGDFGCQIDGNCPLSSTQIPDDGAAQMKHFVADDGMNLMRLPISWQFLVNNQLGGTLDANNLGKYDRLVQACLSTGAHCMIDIHNFARWNGGIIGQGGPTDDQFVSLWAQLATKYAKNDKVVFELMNEPHDLDVALWAQTCQKAVTAIRQAGAASQTILLPGTNFDSAATLVSSGSAAALLAVKNPDGTTDNLVLDIHKYLDEDNSGTHAECVTDNVDALGTVAAFLRENGRQGLISESGASNAASCMTAFCAQNTFINANSDVFVGFVAWAAGSFSSSYVLSLTPSKQNGRFVDSKLMTQCVLAPWLNAKDAPAPSSSVAARPAAPTTASAARPPAAPTGSAAAQSPVFSASTPGVKSPMTSVSLAPQPTGAPGSIALTGSTSVLDLGGPATTISVDSHTKIVMPGLMTNLTMTTLLMATGTPKRPSATDGGGILTAPGAAPLIPQDRKSVV